jgi:hypothetical protein
LRVRVAREVFFWGGALAFRNGGHHGEGQYDKRHVTMPAMPGSRFIMIEAELILGGLKAVFESPSDVRQRRPAA